MYRNNHKVSFIVFEGLDGSGQTTQAGYLYHVLKSLTTIGLQKVVLTEEPAEEYSSGRKIRRALKEEIILEPDEFQKLFVQNRQEHLERLIIPCLDQGTTVILVRYFLSTCAFGGIDLDMECLIELNDKFMLPDITFLLDVSPEVCLERIKRNRTSFEYFEKLDKLIKVEQNYKKLSKLFDNIYLIDGERLKVVVAKDILKEFFKNV